MLTRNSEDSAKKLESNQSDGFFKPLIPSCGKITRELDVVLMISMSSGCNELISGRSVQEFV